MVMVRGSASARVVAGALVVGLGGGGGEFGGIGDALGVSRRAMCFVADTSDHVGVVEFEGRAFGADAGQFQEVVPGRRAGGGPFQ